MSPVFLGFLKKELIQALRDRRMRVLLIVAPLAQMTLFGLALNNEVRNIRLAVQAAPGDVRLLDTARRAWGSGYFVPADCGGLDPCACLKASRADAVLAAPAGGFTRALGRGDGRAQLLVDASNAVKARSVEAYMQRVLAQGAEASGPGALSIQVRVLYNPALRSALFMVPGVMVMVLCIMTIILTAMALARERELGTLETLLVAPISPMQLLAGKILPFFLIALAEVPLLLLAAVTLFGLPVRGPLWMLALGAVGFCGCTVSVGVLISTLARTQQQAMMGGFLFLFPAVQMSGLMFPLENMPWAVRWVSYFDPLRYFVAILRNVLLKWGDSGIFWSNFSILLLMAAVCMVVAVRRFRTTVG